MELHKDGLMMCSSASSNTFLNTYRHGVLAAKSNDRSKDAGKFFKGHMPIGGGSASDAVNVGCTPRTFVAGEKFWVTGVSLQKDGVLVSTFSDPYNDVRYYGEIKFPFPRGSVPTADDFAKSVAEVITPQPREKADQGVQMAQAAAAPMQQIDPPPPPADAPPPTIAIGQTKEQVTAAFGKPVKIAKLGAREIYYYKDMKVTFTNGRVSNVD